MEQETQRGESTDKGGTEMKQGNHGLRGPLLSLPTMVGLSVLSRQTSEAGLLKSWAVGGQAGGLGAAGHAEKAGSPDSDTATESFV